MATEDVEVESHEARLGMPAAADPGPSGRTAEDVLKNLNDAIEENNVESFNQHLAELQSLLPDDSTVGERLAASGALHYAAVFGSVPMVDTLIQKGVDINTKSCICELYGEETPLFVAARIGNVDIVRYLVDNGADVNIKNGRGGTPLLTAVKYGNLVRYLVDKETDVNLTDFCGETALTFAVKSGDVDAVRFLVDKGADVNIKNIFGVTPLHMAVLTGNVDKVRCIVDKVADVNVQFDMGKTPLFMAAERGCIDMVRCLVDKGADVNIKTDHAETALLVASGNGHAEIVKYLLEKGADPTARDCLDCDSLSHTICSRHKDAAAILLGHAKEWDKMLKSSRVGFKKTTPMRELIAVMPDVAEIALNKCVTTNEGKTFNLEEVHATSTTFAVKFNYEFVEDFKDKHSSDSSDESSGSVGSWHPEKFTKKDHPLYLMTKHGCSNLLKHPLVISLLEHKWNRFGRKMFFGNLFIYLIFLAFLTAFGLVALSPVEITCVDVFNGSFNGTVPENCEGLSVHEYRFLYVAAAVTILTAFLRLAMETFQCCSHPLQYLLDWVNWLEIPLYLFSIIFTFVFATPCLCVYSWQWQMGVVAVFLGWVGLITFLQKLPASGVYVLMFMNILCSFVKIAFLALLLVLAFAFALYMLLFDPDEMRTPFSHPGRAVVKVMAMTIGELDFDKLYHQLEGQGEIAFPPLSFLLWIIFLVLMPVLLSNLLVGLAVGDVDRLQKTAYENRIKLQIDLVLSCEELLESLGIRHWFAIKPKRHFPNVPVTLLPQWCKKRGIKDSHLAYKPEHFDPGRLGKVRRWIANWYSTLWITDEYSTSGVKISDAIKAPPESLEKQLQKQRQQLETKLTEQNEHLETKLTEQNENLETKLTEQNEHLETKLTEQNEHLETKLMEQNEHLETKLAEQSEQIETKFKEQSEEIETKLKEQLQVQLEEYSEKQSEQFQEAVRQLSECHKEQAKQSEEKTEQLTGEVASLREALEKLVAQMAAK